MIPFLSLPMLTPTGQNSLFTQTNLSFSDYIGQMRDIIETSRVDLDKPNAQQIIDANSPFEWTPLQPSKPTRGALLIHGLFDSCFALADIGQHLLQNGFLVRSILLPGHGTVPGDLLTTTLEEWVKAVTYGLNTLQAVVEDIVVVGFSTGASLALSLATETTRLKGLILLAPAITINSPFACLAPWIRCLRSVSPRSQWLAIGRGEDYVKYDSYCFHAIAEVYRLTQQLQARSTAPLTVPACVIVTADDEIVSTKSTIDFFSKQRHPHHRLYIYTQKPRKTHDNRIMELNSTYREEKIINFSHVALPFASGNSHYGKQGDYQLILKQDLRKKNPNIDEQQIQYGSLSTPKSIGKPLLRLTYNPDFENMLSHIDDFLLRLT